MIDPELSSIQILSNDQWMRIWNQASRLLLVVLGLPIFEPLLWVPAMTHSSLSNLARFPAWSPFQSWCWQGKCVLFISPQEQLELSFYSNASSVKVTWCSSYLKILNFADFPNLLQINLNTFLQTLRRQDFSAYIPKTSSIAYLSKTPSSIFLLILAIFFAICLIPALSRHCLGTADLMRSFSF
jgi:hypothetical protein